MSVLSLATYGVFEEAGGSGWIPPSVSMEVSAAAMAMLPHRCVIEENALTGETDGGGHPVRAWVALHSGVPCRLYSPGARRVVREVKEASLADYQLMLPLGIELLEMEMRVSGVTDRYGRPAVGRSGDVYEVLGQPALLEAVGVQEVGVRLKR